MITPEVHILPRFALRLAVPETQGRQKLKMHRNWTWTLNSQKYTMYTMYTNTISRDHFFSVSLYDWPFPRYKAVKIGNALTDHKLNLNT